VKENGPGQVDDVKDRLARYICDRPIIFWRKHRDIE
jgi:hypothetical protein